MTRKRMVLPWPPSVNNIARNSLMPRAKAAMLRKQYDQWKADVAILAKANGWPQFGKEKLRAWVCFRPSSNRKLDLDNYEKPVWDALEAAGVFQNDCQIFEKHVIRVKGSTAGDVSIILEPLGNEKGKLHQRQWSWPIELSQEVGHTNNAKRGPR